MKASLFFLTGRLFNRNMEISVVCMYNIYLHLHFNIIVSFKKKSIYNYTLLIIHINFNEYLSLQKGISDLEI